jgi:ABC-type transport system substrate-binding protein
MLTVRLFIYGVPALLAALVLAAFVNATQLVARKKNEFNFGTIAEPTKLNPLQSSDNAASEVEGLIFEGLVKLNEKLDIAPHLAKSWEQNQTTTIYFRTPDDALAAERVLREAADSWAVWTLQDVSVEGSKLILGLSMPGMDGSRSIVASLDAASLTPVVTVRADLSGNARKTLEKFRLRHPAVIIERVWFDYDSAFEISVVGDVVETERILREFLKTSGDEKAAVAISDRRDFLAEPALRFQLRDDVRWQDGAPFTSRDCAFTYDCIMSEEVASPRKADYDLIQKVEAPGPHEFIVTYRIPYSPALLSWTIPLLPAHILEDKPQEWWAKTFNRNPVGTGPFKFDSWKTNEYVRLVRNPVYWGGGPWLDAFIFRVIPDPAVLRLAFETRQLDIYELYLSPWALSTFRNDPRFTVLTVPKLSYSYIGWNLRKEMFQDVRVRRAFAHAVNVPEIVEHVLYGTGVQSTGIFIPEFWFADPDIEPIPYDPQRSRELLDEAGWKVGPGGIRVKDGRRLAFKLITNQGNEIRKDIATLVQDDLRQVGADVSIEIYEWAVFIERFIKKLEFEANVLGWVTPPNYDEFQLWHSSQIGIDQMNHPGYQSPEADRLIVELRQEYDRTKIKALASKLQRLIYKDQPVLFVNSFQDPYPIWKDSFRIRRKTDHGWIDTPFEVVTGTWYYFADGYYRPEFESQLPPATEIVE